jgi:hypothetical protein
VLPFGNISNPRVLSDMGLAIFSSYSSSPCSSSITGFENYLKAQRKSNFKQILCYAQKYHSTLDTGDASTLANAKPSVRRHVLESLAILSKWCGKYNHFKDICARYQLRWGSANEDNLRYFTNYLHGNGNLDVMVSWLKKDALHKLPPQLGNVLLYNTLSGLRFSESLLSIRLIQTDFERYANKELGIFGKFQISRIY